MYTKEGICFELAKLFTSTTFSDNSDLCFRIDNDGLCARPWVEGGFAMVWAGARATYGVKTGKVAYEVKVGNITMQCWAMKNLFELLSNYLYVLNC